MSRFHQGCVVLKKSMIGIISMMLPDLEMKPNRYNLVLEFVSRIFVPSHTHFGKPVGSGRQVGPGWRVFFANARG